MSIRGCAALGPAGLPARRTCSCLPAMAAELVGRTAVGVAGGSAGAGVTRRMAGGGSNSGAVGGGGAAGGAEGGRVAGGRGRSGRRVGKARRRGQVAAAGRRGQRAGQGRRGSSGKVVVVVWKAGAVGRLRRMEGRRGQGLLGKE